MKGPIALAASGLLIFAGTIAYTIWWSVSHNFVNVSCTNFVYHSKHLQQCATWNLGNGIEAGVAIPLILAGLAVLVVGVIWGFHRRGVL